MAVSGNLRDMSLTTLISVNCTEGNQARLRLRHGELAAEIYFYEGEIAHIVLDDRQGEEILDELLTWQDGLFDLEMEVPPPTRSVHTPWSNLVLGGMQRADETALAVGYLEQAQAEMEVDEMADEMQDLLREMAGEIPGFIATDIVGMDGLSIAHHTSDSKFDAEAASAQFALVMKLVQRTTAQIKAGDVEDNLVTTDRLYIITRFLGRDNSYYLGLAVDKNTASLGNVRLVTRRYAPRLWDAIPKD